MFWFDLDLQTVIRVQETKILVMSFWMVTAKCWPSLRHAVLPEMLVSSCPSNRRGWRSRYKRTEGFLQTRIIEHFFRVHKHAKSKVRRLQCFCSFVFEVKGQQQDRGAAWWPQQKDSKISSEQRIQTSDTVQTALVYRPTIPWRCLMLSDIPSARCPTGGATCFCQINVSCKRKKRSSARWWAELGDFYQTSL